MEKGGEESRFENLEQVGAIALNFADFEKPIIAVINGVAVGAGFSLALLCDIRLASVGSTTLAGFFRNIVAVRAEIDQSVKSKFLFLLTDNCQ